MGQNVQQLLLMRLDCGKRLSDKAASAAQLNDLETRFPELFSLVVVAQMATCPERREAQPVAARPPLA